MTAAGGGAGCPRTPPERLRDSPSRSRIQRRRLSDPSEDPSEDSDVASARRAGARSPYHDCGGAPADGVGGAGAEPEPLGGHRRGFSSEPERGYSETEDAEAEEECASWAGSAAGAEAEAEEEAPSWAGSAAGAEAEADEESPSFIYEESPSWSSGERRWREAEARGDLDHESSTWSDSERRAVREGRDHDESPLQELKSDTEVQSASSGEHRLGEQLRACLGEPPPEQQRAFRGEPSPEQLRDFRGEPRSAQEAGALLQRRHTLERRLDGNDADWVARAADRVATALARARSKTAPSMRPPLGAFSGVEVARLATLGIRVATRPPAVGPRPPVFPPPVPRPPVFPPLGGWPRPPVNPPPLGTWGPRAVAMWPGVEVGGPRPPVGPPPVATWRPHTWLR